MTAIQINAHANKGQSHFCLGRRNACGGGGITESMKWYVDPFIFISARATAAAHSIAEGFGGQERSFAYYLGGYWAVMGLGIVWYD